MIDGTDVQDPPDTTTTTGSTQTTGGGGGGNGGPPSDPTAEVKKSIALAEVMKPLEGPADDLYSADKQPARDKVNASYAQALAPDGDLRVKLDNAHDDFDQAAAKSLPRVPAFVQLLSDKGAIGALLKQRQDLGQSLKDRMGKNETTRADAQQSTKKWADAYTNWSSPADKMGAMVGEYAAKIEPLKSQVVGGTNPNAAMLSLWLEVAPKHLQISDKSLSADAQKATQDISKALKPYGLDSRLSNGKDRGDGSLYIVAPDQLQSTRESVLQNWMAVAEKQAEAEATYKMQPDDSASIKQRWDKLKDEGWLQEAKKQALDKPA